MNCRFCNKKLKRPFLSLGNSPLSNSYLTESELHKMEAFYPLEVYVCNRCFLMQIEEFETAEKIFSNNYAYFSSYSSTWLRHCREYVEMIMNRFDFGKDSLVVEIASNDGYLLQYFKEHNVPVLGIEVAGNVAKVAMEKGIPTKIAYFDSLYAKKMVRQHRKADLIIGNNVLAHNPNLNDFVRGLKIALKPKGLVTMEFPHLLRLINENQFDTIYHEHFSYFSFYAVRKIFAFHGIELFDVEEIPTHGGSLRIFGKHKEDRTKRATKKVPDLLKREKEEGLFKVKTYYDFAKKVYSTKQRLLQALFKIKNQGKKIIGYGAPAKGNTLLNYCGIRNDILNYTVDLSPHKQNKFLPGTHIPIKNPNVIKKDRPDYIMILPWNLKDEIIEQRRYIKEWGGKFIIPIPELKIIK